MALVGKMLKFDWSSISYEEMTMTLMSKIAKRQKNPEMKSNISELVTEDGCKVYLVGTTHFSKQSIKDVQQIIREVQPDAVVLEVCQYREQLLTLDEQLLLNGNKTFDTCTMLQSMKQFGLMQTLWSMLFLRISAYLIEELGMAPGGEFRKAFREVLLYFSKMIMKELKQKDRLEEEIQITMKEVPGLYRVLITERDAYLTQSLKQAAKPIVLPKILRSDAQKVIPSVVVGVVGIGHVAGIKKNWNKQFNTQELLRLGYSQDFPVSTGAPTNLEENFPFHFPKVKLNLVPSQGDLQISNNSDIIRKPKQPITLKNAHRLWIRQQIALASMFYELYKD